jgi:hypothetical protein
MSFSTSDQLANYGTHGSISHPGENAGRFDRLPSAVAQLCSTIQGMLLHKHWAERYGETDPQKFGIFDMHGLYFIRGNLIHDMAALKKSRAAALGRMGFDRSLGW